jgi:hypothetical protein
VAFTYVLWKGDLYAEQVEVERNPIQCSPVRLHNGLWLQLQNKIKDVVCKTFGQAPGSSLGK